MAMLDLRGQFWVERRQLFALRRPNVRRKVCTVFTPEGSKQKQIGHLGCAQPRKAASLLGASEGKTPIAVDPVPAEMGEFQSFAGHGFHRVSENGFDLSNLDRHGLVAGLV
jgi:hypothetical protein